MVGGLVASQAPGRQRLNPVIELLEEGKPVFGLYAPSNRRGRVARGATPAPAVAPRSPLELAREALAFKAADYIFDGSMEGSIERGLPGFTEFVRGMQDAGALRTSPFLRLTHPLMVKTPEIAPDPAKAVENIGRQLNLGVSGIVFVSVESADELRHGLAAMRFKNNGGTRPDDVGSAPAAWGMSEKEYRQKADLWPLNPDGELISWTIVESKDGLARVREIAAVKGIGALFPGAGTLRGLYTATSASGERVFDQAGWEAAIQQVLAACKEFKVPCGYPATASDIEMRMKQGFSVFVINWGEAGFKAVEIGRRLGNRPDTNQ
jgi:4-hydroxy-2-oxoheptanedioate aldolase